MRYAAARPLVGKNVAPYNPAGGLGNSAKNWWCSMKASEGKEATSNPGQPLPRRLFQTQSPVCASAARIHCVPGPSGTEMVSLRGVAW
eukprot:945833-Rhodomonas_salina.1